MDYILWTDVETTGLSLSDDYLLEAAFVLTPAIAPDVILYQFSEHLNVAPETVESWSAKMPEVVQDMHTASGLLDDLTNKYGRAVSHTGEAFAPPLAERQYLRWDTEVSEFLTEFTHHTDPGSKIRIGGNSVHFDLGWIRQEMPKTAEFLHYSTVDVSGMARNLEYMNVKVDVTENKAHRALTDVMESIQNFQAIMSRMEFLNDRAASNIAIALPFEGDRPENG